jgi:hypothetical protein
VNGKQLFIFDDNDVWGGALSEHLAELVPAAAAGVLRATRPKYGGMDL